MYSQGGTPKRVKTEQSSSESMFPEGARGRFDNPRGPNQPAGGFLPSIGKVTRGPNKFPSRGPIVATNVPDLYPAGGSIGSALQSHAAYEKAHKESFFKHGKGWKLQKGDHLPRGYRMNAKQYLAPFRARGITKISRTAKSMLRRKDMHPVYQNALMQQVDAAGATESISETMAINALIAVKNAKIARQMSRLHGGQSAATKAKISQFWSQYRINKYGVDNGPRSKKKKGARTVAPAWNS